MPEITLGSLFDGSGGFPLGAMMNGITPVWASEIEPFPIRVTTKRIPQMKHYGDICKINGGEIEPVDIISFGSPCTDLSLAGKRSGIGGSKSSLFFEAIRVIKEMRCKTYGRYPRFIVWENVPGAFSSGKSHDFRTVLEEIAKIKDETISIPMPPKDKWLTAGEIMGDDFSIAYRTIDAQFWGVPQRRRRIYLVADFGGKSAPEILFESEGMRRNTTKSESEGQGATTNAKSCTGEAISSQQTGKIIKCYGFEPGAMSRLGGHYSSEQACTLRAQMGDNRLCIAVMNERQQGLPVSENIAHTLLTSDFKGPQCVFENHGQDTRFIGPLDVAQTVMANYGTGGNNQPFVVSEKKAYGICSDKSNSMLSDNPHSGVYETETSRTIDQAGGNPACNQGGIAVVALQGSMIGRADKNGPQGDGIGEDVSFTLNTVDRHGVVYAIDRETFNCGQNFARNLGISTDGTTSTLNAQGPSAVAQPASFYPQMKAESQCYRQDGTANTIVNGTNPGYQNGIVEPTYTVRRLTPSECALLQGFNINWCSNLETENPTDEDISFWANVFETHRKIMGTSSKPKSKKQIIKWLKNPYSDGTAYKLWGNGVALPCVSFVMCGIANVMRSS